MISESSFREEMPAFADITQYPSFQFNFYLNLGKKLLREERWGHTLDYGLTLFIAHYLTLYKRAMGAASIGGDAGKIVGMKHRNQLMVFQNAMDVSGVLIADAGHWNQTTFGVQFYQLLMMAGAGGIQL